MVILIRVLTMFIDTLRVQAITEDENEISMRSADHTRERPRLEGLDMDTDTYQEIEVRIAKDIN